MKTKKKGSAKSSKKPSRAPSPETESKPEGKKTLRIQGIQVLTPDGKKKSGRRGALGYLRLRDIKVVPDFNPRKEIGDLTELEKSIRKNGLLEPLVVRPSGDGKTFNLIAGERRHRVLKSIGAPLIDSVPVNIRTDLEGDDLGAMAVAIAENSDDGRTNLSPLDIGFACERLVKKKWTTEAIAAHTGLHLKKVRRCLQVVNAGEEIVERVRKGTLGMMAAIEVHKLPPKERAEILTRSEPSSTVEDIRRIRKSIEREERSEAIAKGEGAKAKSSKGPERRVTVRRSQSELRDKLRLMCHTFINLSEKQRDTDDFYEMRGGIGALLWVQGDLDDAILTSLDVDSEADPKAAKKANAALDILIKNVAAEYKLDDEANEAA